MAVIPSKLSDYKLGKYYRILDALNINDLDLVHYQIVKNEMIKRELLKEEIISPNEFQTFEQTNERSALANVPVTFSVAETVDYDVPFTPCDNTLYLSTNNLTRI